MCVAYLLTHSSRKMALLQVSGGFEAGEPNSESISRSAIAELIVKSSFSARRSVCGALLDAVEKSRRFGFIFVMSAAMCFKTFCTIQIFGVTNELR